MAVSAARWVAITALAGAGFALGSAVAPRHHARAALTQAAKTVVERPVISSPGALARAPALVRAKRHEQTPARQSNPDPGNTAPAHVDSTPVTGGGAAQTTPYTTTKTTTTHTDTGAQPPPFQPHTGTGGSSSTGTGGSQ